MNNLVKETNLKFVYAAIIIVGLYFLSVSLINLQSILAPLAISLVFALSMVPLSKKLEQLGLNRGIASLVCALIVFLIFAGISWIVIDFISGQSKELPKLWEEIKPKINDASNWISQKFNLPDFNLIEKLRDYGENSFQSIGKTTIGIVSGTLNGLGNTLLIVVYTFFILNYRTHFANFLYKLTSDNHDSNVRDILHKSVTLVRKYIIGRLILVGILTVCYGIGYMIIGLEYAWVIAIVSALFSILPIIGNILAAGLASVVALLTSGDIMMVVWVLVIFSITQFLESYVLTPLILGNEVDLHPFITLIAVFIGGALWGFEGYLLALPYSGILKVILDQSKSTQPYAFLLSDDTSNLSFGDKIKEKIKDIKS